MRSYSKRRSFFEKDEWLWNIEDEAMRMRDHNGREVVVPWENVASVRIAYAPTRYKTWRHMIELKLKSGGKIEIDNAHFSGIADFENRSASYAPFVRAMVKQIAAKAPDARCSLGAAPVGYWLSMAMLVVVFGVLGLLLLAIPIDGVPGVAFVKLGIIAFFIPTLVMWAIKARPRGAVLSEVPDSALPRVA